MQNAVASGAFASQEDALKHALELLAVEQQAPAQSGSADRAARFRAWAEGHSPANHFVDDSRESIY
ncbi:hypothetical protein LOC68_25925 [Blastopirellula sp. JC732]|uniref:Uncharacterized protein n=1 Tax=Blastopirellula sediminis TaxID=2894196 RepID=A0A9X1MUI3_9BACT|nr:hypothetical protein [Blastopirellula sediminis]